MAKKKAEMCGCGHDACGCEHDACGCGHDACGCEHDACGCGHDVCGCEHAHGNKKPITNPGPVFNAGQPNDKGVSLGADVEQDIATEMKKRYKRFLAPDEVITAKTEVCHQFGYVSAHLENADKSSLIDVEVCVECDPNMIESPMDAYDRALDTIDAVLLDFFDSDRISHYLPIWQEYQVDDLTANIRFEHVNKALDDEASAFLLAHGFTEGGLVPEPEEDAEEVVECVDDEDDDEADPSDDE